MMKITLSWLKEYLDTEASLSEICHKLTNIGLEVEEVIDHSTELQAFNCVYILEAKPHPDADKLRICTVDTGSETLQIVCGAPNARKDMKAILAPIGSVIPHSDITIKKSKLRGVDSCGMLCSAQELNLDLGSDSSTGIIEVDMSVAIGTNVADIFGIRDPLIDISITPNRGDCLGVYGIARDLYAAGLGGLKADFFDDSDAMEAPNSDCHWPSPIHVEVKSKNCAIFEGRYIHGVKNCESPAWLQKRLTSVGMHSVSAIVDISNYIMYITGKPLHIYDANKITNNTIIVRDAKDNEKFVALNGQEYTLDTEMVSVADTKKTLCLGGVIGGENSCTTMETSNIFIESAIFEPSITTRTGRTLNIETDARYRLERGVDLVMNTVALNMAAKLIQEICGGQISERVQDDNLNASRYYSLERRVVEYNQHKINQILGTNISLQDGLTILMRLGFDLMEDEHVKIVQHNGISQTVINTDGHPQELSDAELESTSTEDECEQSHCNNHCHHCHHHAKNSDEMMHNAENITFKVQVPYHRNDISIPEDLAEEIIRLYGLDTIQNQPLPIVPIDLEAKRHSEQYYNLQRLLCSRGLTETCTFSFIEEKKALLFTAFNPALKLLNPISTELGYMRGSVIPSLLEAYNNNKVRGFKDIALFELARVFQGAHDHEQPMYLTGIRTGFDTTKNIYHDERMVDFFDIKSDVVATLQALELDTSKLLLENCSLDYYHPTRSAVWKMGNKPIAFFGELHPEILKHFDITQRVYAFEIILDNIPVKKHKTTTKSTPDISDFQDSKRDFAFIVPASLNVDKIRHYVCHTLKNSLIKGYHLFDVFQTPHDPEHKSVAFTISLQANDRTLDGKEIEEISQQLIVGIEKEFQAKLRDK